MIRDLQVLATSFRNTDFNPIARRWGGKWNAVDPKNFLSVAQIMPHDVTVVDGNGVMAGNRFASKMTVAIVDGSSAIPDIVPAGVYVFDEGETVDLKAVAIEEVTQCCRDPEPLFWHFVRHSEIFGARELAERYKGEAWAETGRDYIDRHWSFIFGGPAEISAKYQTIGAGFQGNWEDHTQTERYRLMRDWLAETGAKSAVDLGCAYGFYGIPLARETGAHIVGYDLDARARHYANEVARRDGIAFEAREGDETAIEGEYDAALLGEILEHVVDPTETIGLVESRVREGGWIVGSVPYGPWEHLSYHEEHSIRAHVREIEWHDLVDMIGDRPELSVSVVPYGSSYKTGEALGWYVFRWQVDHEPVGRIDMNRKIRFQRVW